MNSTRAECSSRETEAVPGGAGRRLGFDSGNTLFGSWYQCDAQRQERIAIHDLIMHSIQIRQVSAGPKGVCLLASFNNGIRTPRPAH